jgi:hypothetical protein
MKQKKSNSLQKQQRQTPSREVSFDLAGFSTKQVVFETTTNSNPAIKPKLKFGQ